MQPEAISEAKEPLDLPGSSMGMLTHSSREAANVALPGCAMDMVFQGLFKDKRLGLQQGLLYTWCCPMDYRKSDCPKPHFEQSALSS